MDLAWSGEVPERAKVLCVLVHGRGQSPEDMIDAIVAPIGAVGAAFAMPRAEGKSWYKAKAVDPLTDQTRMELEASLDQLASAIGTARARVPDVPLLLAGFSQGACLSLEFAMRGGPWKGAIAALTGARVGRSHDARPEARLGGMHVYLTGGDADPWIPVDAVAEATQSLARAQARLRVEVFPGRGHEVTSAEIEAMRQMLSALAEGREVWG